ncbi:hypothetical protein A4R44_09341 [Amycolatopsis sp. M39]|nr:hypothetical protein A4R44_09341 [Amycolatopsis sp. M39]
MERGTGLREDRAGRPNCIEGWAVLSIVLTMQRLRIKTAAGWQEPYDLDAPMVAIIGPVDTGKSSLLDAIAYALGREIDFRGAVDYHLTAVELTARIGGPIFTLCRYRGNPDQVEVFDQAGTPEGPFPITTTGRTPTLSEWILEQLGLADMFAAVRLTGRKQLDFANSLLPYCYLTQPDIDRHIIRSARHNKARVQVLRLLFELTTAEHEHKLGEIEEHDIAIRQMVAKEKTISEFLDETHATERDAVRTEIARLRGEEAAAIARLNRARSSLQEASSVGTEQQSRLERAATEHAAAETAYDKHLRLLEKARDAVADAEEALARLTDLETAPAAEPTLSLVQPGCPECGSPLSPAPAGTCYLCRNLIPGMDHAEQRRHLVEDYQRAVATEKHEREEARRAHRHLSDALSARTQLRGHLDTSTYDTASPYVGQVSAAAAELAGIQASLGSLTRLDAAHVRVDQQRERIEQLRAEQEQRQRKAVLNPADVRNLDDVVRELNLAFRSIIRGIGLPNATGRAEIHPDTLLPIVDDQKFLSRGGGARSAVSIGYSLALLRYTMERSTAQLPGFLAIDSPQKNFGSNSNDQALAHRVYERFLDYLDDVQKRHGAGTRTYQVIVVDNDLDKSIAKRCLVHRFERDRGFIRDLTDPHRRPGAAQQLAFDDFDDDTVTP